MAYNSSIHSPTPDLAMRDKVISVRDAAEISGVSTATLKRRAQAGDLKILKLSVRRRGIRMSELQRWLEACGSARAA